MPNNENVKPERVEKVKPGDEIKKVLHGGDIHKRGGIDVAETPLNKLPDPKQFEKVAPLKPAASSDKGKEKA